MITYICAVYLGPRKSKLSNQYWNADPYYFVRQHLQLLSTAAAAKVVEKIIFSVSHYNNAIDLQIKDVIDSFKLKIPVVVDFKKNQGFSYARWNEAIKSELQQPDYDINKHLNDYFLLIEDDYIPDSIEKLQLLINLYRNKSMEGNIDVGYLCQYIDHECAAISNGIMLHSVAHKVYSELGDVFSVKVSNSEYSEGTHNQQHFTDLLIRCGYKLCDMVEHYSSMFFESSDDSFKTYGDASLPCIFKPIQTPSLVTLTLKQPADIIDMRNAVCDSLTYNYKMPIEQFNKFVDDCYIVEYFSEPIGYALTYHTSSKNKYCYIEIGLLSRFTNMGLGKMTLYSMIELYKERMYKLVLEIPADNHVGMHVASKLKFKEDTTIPKHILRGKTYIDSKIYVNYLL